MDRADLIRAMANALEPLSFVHAFYEGGAPANGSLDEWSDIDVYAVVDPDKVEETFEAVRSSLKAMSPVRQEYFIGKTGWEGVHQTFIALENASPYLVVDLAIIEMGSKHTFLEPEVHGNALFLFNKGGIVKARPWDQEAHGNALEARRRRVIERVRLFHTNLEKEIRRRNWVEAADLYNRLVLSSLVELLRMRYYPAHYDFGMRYVHRELPREVVDRLVALSYVRSPGDLQDKYKQALAWFSEEAGEQVEKVD